MAVTTIKDIARICGVGVSTVSRAINNHPDINPETKKRIMEVIQEKGFVPNDSARYLKRSESDSIAFLVKGISNPFFMGMVRVMEDFTQKKKFASILRHVDNDEDEVQTAQALIKERKLKGIVFLGGNFNHTAESLKQITVPYIFCTVGNEDEFELDGREKVNEQVRYANVAVDDLAESEKAISYLIQQGHRQIGIITEGLKKPSIGQLRYLGYKKALREHGLDFDENLVYEIVTDGERYSRENGYNGAMELLKRNPKLTAIFCISDVIAIGAMRAIIDTGRKIPDDISVVGFDGIDEGKYCVPRLTTVEQPQSEMAEATIQFLFDMIEGKRSPDNMLMDAKLVIRESSGSGYRKQDDPKESE